MNSPNPRVCYWSLAPVIAALAAFGLAGCGSSATEPTKTATTTSSTPSAQAPATTTPGPVCATMSADQTNRLIGADSGTLSFPVAADSGCAWTAALSGDFLQIAAGSSGTGTGTVTVSFQSNTADTRTGTLSVGATTVTITQTAPVKA